MKQITQYIQEKLKINSKSKVNTYNYYPETKEELENIIVKLIEKRGSNADLNDIDTSKITNMSHLFSKTNYDYSSGRAILHKRNKCFYSFNGDISQWNVSNVEDMDSMFYESEFNGDISSWNVSKVKNMREMFRYSKFNGDISQWDVSNVKYIGFIFDNSPFKGNISKWNINNAKDIINKDKFKKCYS